MVSVGMCMGQCYRGRLRAVVVIVWVLVEVVCNSSGCCGGCFSVGVGGVERIL